MDAADSIARTLLKGAEPPRQSFAGGTCVEARAASAAVLLDGDAEPVELPLESGAAGVSAGDRCLVACWGREASVQSYRLTESN